MELKGRMGITNHDEVMCFNRTFMELKDAYARRLQEVVKFQSHLYGIESKIGEGTYTEKVRFNRTFMELKAIGGRCVMPRYPVSIAPLWN